MTIIGVILLCGISAAFGLLALAVTAFRRSWRVLIHLWYPHASPPAALERLAADRRAFWHGVLLLIGAGFIAYGTLMVWGLSQT
jgi:hypothetical protein